MSDVLAQLEESHDLVIVDSPPVLAVADALELAQMCSATLLVASANHSSQRAIKRAIERLGHIGVVISGGVLNDIHKDSMGSYYGYYEAYEDHTTDEGQGEPSGPARYTSNHREVVAEPTPRSVPSGSRRSSATSAATPVPSTSDRAAQPQLPQQPRTPPAPPQEPARVDVRGRLTPTTDGDHEHSHNSDSMPDSPEVPNGSPEPVYRPQQREEPRENRAPLFPPDTKS